MTRRTARARALALIAATAMTSTLLSAAPAAAADHDKLINEYSTLSGALMNVYATSAGMSLESYLDAQQIMLAPPTLEDPLAPQTAEPLLDENGEPVLDENGEPLYVDAEGNHVTASELNQQATDTATDASTDGATTSATDSPSATVTPSLPKGKAKSLNSNTKTATPAMLLGKLDAKTMGASATRINAKTVTGLNRQLAGAGVNMDTRNFKNLSSLANAVKKNSATPDGAVTLAGAKWATQINALRTPTLKTPAQRKAAGAAVPQGALPYGLLMNKSLTTMMKDYPNMFADAKKSGIGSSKVNSAWNKSMSKAFNNSQADFSKVLPDPCTTTMMSVMASGNAKGTKKSAASCSPGCITSGLYLHNQAQTVFNPSRRTVTADPTASVWNSTTYNALPAWTRGVVQQQNPTVRGTLTDKLSQPNFGSCSQATSATKSTVKSTLPGVFASLRR